MVIYTKFEIINSYHHNFLLFNPVNPMPDFDVAGTIIGELVRLTNRQVYLRVKHPDGVFAVGNFNERQVEVLQEKGLKVGFKVDGIMKVVSITMING